MTTLMSHVLFGHCSTSVSVDDVSTDNTVLFIDTGDLIITNEPSLELMRSSFVSTDTELFISDETQTLIPDDYELCSPLISDEVPSTEINHDSHTCSGFMLIDDNFVTFSDDSGACEWGTSMSINGDDW